MLPLLRVLAACVPVLVLAACQRDTPAAAAPAPAPEEVVAAVNRGVAHMGRYDFAAAAAEFVALGQRQPASREAGSTWRLPSSIGRVTVTAPRPSGSFARSRRIRPWAAPGYTLGLLLLYGGRDADAFPS